MSISEIQSTSISKWMETIKMQATKNTLIHLNSNIGSKTQSYTELKMSNFLCSIDTSQFVAKAVSYD